MKVMIMTNVMMVAELMPMKMAANKMIAVDTMMKVSDIFTSSTLASPVAQWGITFFWLFLLSTTVPWVWG